jgi:membrane associated rhomboid family serine protease
MPNFLEDIISYFSKWYVYLFYILIGIVGKFSWDISRRRKITFLSAISTVGISGFIGYISSVYCSNNAMENQAAYIVPICTLLSDKIISYLIFRVKWKEIRDAIFNTD